MLAWSAGEFFRSIFVQFRKTYASRVPYISVEAGSSNRPRLPDLSSKVALELPSLHDAFSCILVFVKCLVYQEEAGSARNFESLPGLEHASTHQN